MYKEQPAQAEARQYPIMEGGGHELPPLAKELLAVDSFWEGGAAFFKVQPFTLIQETRSSTSWTGWAEKETSVAAWEGRRGSGRSRVRMIKIYCRKFLKY